MNSQFFIDIESLLKKHDLVLAEAPVITPISDSVEYSLPRVSAWGTLLAESKKPVNKFDLLIKIERHGKWDAKQ